MKLAYLGTRTLNFTNFLHLYAKKSLMSHTGNTAPGSIPAIRATIIITA